MKATLKDIARIVGVSEPAVSYALRGVPKVSPAVRDRILAAAEDLGYRPHAAARVMASGRFHAVTLLQDAWQRHSFLTPEMIQGIHDALERRDLMLNVARLTRDQMENAAELPRSLRELSADGLLVNVNTSPPPPMIAVLERIRIPSIWLNIRRKRDCVHPDDAGAAAALVHALVESGCRHVGYFDPRAGEPYQHYSKDDRYAGYQSAIRKLRLRECSLRLPPSDDLMQTAQAFREWVDAHAELDGLITYSENDLDLYLHHVRPKLNKRPRSPRLASFFNPHQHRLMPALRAEHPSAEMGRAAVECLAEKMAAPKRGVPARAVSFDIRQPLLPIT